MVFKAFKRIWVFFARLDDWDKTVAQNIQPKPRHKKTVSSLVQPGVAMACQVHSPNSPHAHLLSVALRECDWQMLQHSLYDPKNPTRKAHFNLNSHRIHVGYIYPDLVYFYDKCRKTYVDPMGLTISNFFQGHWKEKCLSTLRGTGHLVQEEVKVYYTVLQYSLQRPMLHHHPWVWLRDAGLMGIVALKKWKV